MSAKGLTFIDLLCKLLYAPSFYFDIGHIMRVIFGFSVNS
jgi:hypothetical protein